jgi:hypothetical protein
MGELFNTQHEYVPLIKDRLIDFIRIHISQIGGLSPARKVAALCEFFGVRTAWHGPGDASPVAHAAQLALELASYNFGIHEGGNFPKETQRGVRRRAPGTEGRLHGGQRAARARRRGGRGAGREVPVPGRVRPTSTTRGAPRGGATARSSGRDVDTSTPECTRGAIIPLLAGCPRLADVVRCLGGDRGDGGSSRTGRPAFLDRYRPFRVVAASRDAMVEAVWDRNSLRVRQQPLEGPRLRTSSSLGDALVTRPRAALFRQWFRSRPVDPRVQDAFHRHQWPGRTRVSVLMAREDACTASVTTIELHAERATMEYVALDGGMSGRATLSLTEQEAGFRSKARPGCHR